MAHVSSAVGATEFLNDMIRGLSATNHSDVSVSLARSFASYKSIQEEEIAYCKKRNVPFDEPNAEAYFKAMDEEYIELFKKDFAAITPEFLDMPHDFLTIDSQGRINLCAECDTDKIKHASVKKEGKAFTKSTSSDSVSSPHGFFNSPAQPSEVSYSPQLSEGTILKQ
ncbi:MAG: hypothetical protein PSV35_00285 [bacterium]|nr:hypothetical protein [bacterium]